MRKTQIWMLALLIPLTMGIVFSGCKEEDDPPPCPTVDYTSIDAAIAEAQDLHDNAVEGTNPGEYTDGSKAALQTAIDLATQVRNTNCVTQQQLDAAEVALEAAMVVFENQKITDVNPDALVAQWLFNGDATDASGNGHDGTVSAGYPSWGAGMPELAEDRHGMANYCYYFLKGGNIVVPNSTSFNPPDLTISVWMKLDTLWPHNYFISNDIWHCWKFQVPEHLKPFFTRHLTADDGSGEIYVDKDANPVTLEEPFKWQHVVMTYTKGKIVFYIDGAKAVEWTDFPDGTPIDPHDGIDLCIGQALPTDDFSSDPDDPHAWKAWTGYFKGWMDDIRIYNEVLTDAQVTSLYNYEKDNVME
jgi:hypothetical protein